MHKAEILQMMRQIEPGKTVYVLGAGFTRAFASEAPLAEGDYLSYLSPNLDELANTWTARHVVLREMQRRGRHKVNIERLMTRLRGGAPYDPEDADLELQGVFRQIKHRLRVSLSQVTPDERYRADLERFARHCLHDRVTVITFNYDLLLDKALHDVRRSGSEDGTPHWCPDSGYGFRCMSAFDRRCETCARLPCDVTLLKLHGSINWLTRRGYASPYPLDAIVHSEEWCLADDDWDRVEYVHEHLAEEPLIVPPLLAKSELMREPVLRQVWRRAYDALWKAQHVVFVGYSMPLTDMASKFMFWEALDRVGLVGEPGKPGQSLRVVGYAHDEKQQLALKNAYRDVFRSLPDEWFRFDGALAWAQEVSAHSSPPSSTASSPTSTA